VVKSALIVLAACAACERKPAAPAGTVVDEGVFVTTQDGTPIARETFAIRRVVDHLVITAHGETLDGAPIKNTQEGELETDLAYHPLRLSYRYEAGRESFRDTIGGTPLALDRVRDDGKDPEHVVASGPVDLFVEGPGTIALTAVCHVSQPATLVTLSTLHSGYRGKVLIRSVTPAGPFTRLTIRFLGDFELEVYCRGDKLIASGLRGNALWNVREGSEAELAPIRDAKAP
jgi:hypothetical protein